VGSTPLSATAPKGRPAKDTCRRWSNLYAVKKGSQDWGKDGEEVWPVLNRKAAREGAAFAKKTLRGTNKKGVKTINKNYQGIWEKGRLKIILIPGNG